MVGLKQLQKQLETKDAEKAKAEQAAYDTGMTKTAESLTTQLRDIARAFCLEVWGQALIAVGVNTELKLKAPNRVYCLPALRLAPSPSQPSTDPGLAPTSSSEQPTATPPATPAKEKEKEHLAPTNVVNMETEEVVEVAQLKRKKKEKEQEKKGGKETETSTQPSSSLEVTTQLCNQAQAQFVPRLLLL